MVFATEPFEVLATSVADSLGLPEARIVVVPHPLGGTDQAKVVGWAEVAVDRLVEVLGA